jgi:DNA modification methylase
LMDGQKANLWLTDPPYNIAYEGGSKKRKAIENDSMGSDDFRQFLRSAYSVADMHLCPGAAFYIWHADTEGYNFRGAAIDIDWNVRQTLIWNKNNSAFGRSDFHWKHEPCLYGWKEGAAHSWYNDRKQTTVLDFDRPSRSEQHPTMKPVALIEYCLGNNTQQNAIVLDSFGGSGTTLIACEKQHRHARLMELDPTYCDVIVKRWEDFTGKKATLEEHKEAL